MNWRDPAGWLDLRSVAVAVTLAPPERAKAIAAVPCHRPLSSPDSELDPPASSAGCACVTLGSSSRSPIAHRLLVMK